MKIDLKMDYLFLPLVWENIKQTADRLNVENLERFEKAIK